ncbi:MAG: heavy metal translocating P-type ATPase [Planctomycetota bacterium]
MPTAEKMVFQVRGMTCTGCAAGLQRVLETQPGVESAYVSFTTGLATISGTQLAAQRLIEVIAGRGFQASLHGNGNFESHTLSHIEQQQALHERLWRRRAILGVSLWLPLEVAHWMAAATHTHSVWMQWFMFSGALVILIFAGAGFYRSAWSAAIRRTTNMDTLISLGATTAFVYSTIVFFGGFSQPTYFAEAAGLLGIVSLGHWLEARATAKAGSAVRELLRLQPETAEVESPYGLNHRIPTSDVKVGMKLLIRPGGRIPVDGLVASGNSAVDESVVTGESLPIEKQPGDIVVAGSMNIDGQLTMTATTSGRESTLSRIAAMVQQAQTSRAPSQRLADSVSAIFVPAVLLIAVATVVGWSMVGQFSRGIINAVTVLIISCPCALGLATPMAVMVGTGAASLRGLLIRNAETLERLGNSTDIVFDKTGTLTSGQLSIAFLEPVAGITESELLQMAAAVEQNSEHPIAQAVTRAAQERGLRVPAVRNFRATPGFAVQGLVNETLVIVERDLHATARVSRDGQTLGTFSVVDRARPDAAEAIRLLRNLGLNVHLLSGDRQAHVMRIADSVGIIAINVTSEATPESKARFMQSLGPTGVMVGDGINDAIALAGSGVGIAMASGTSVAMEAASVVIPGQRVCSVPELIIIARKTLRAIRQNLFFAFFYNAMAIPAAASGLLGDSGPLWAAMAMGFSDITVVGNALRLKRQLSAERSASAVESDTGVQRSASVHG